MSAKPAASAAATRCPAVPDDEAVAVTDEPHRRRLQALLEPPAVALHRRPVDAARPTLGDADQCQRDVRRHRPSFRRRPAMERKERESNPQGRKTHPFSRRDTAPVAVLPEMVSAGVEPAPRRLRVGSSRRLSYETMDVAGRNRTCGAPRFRRPLYQAELRPRVMGHRRTLERLSTPTLGSMTIRPWSGLRPSRSPPLPSRSPAAPSEFRRLHVPAPGANSARR
jgi:hypothetical protein